MTEKKKEREGDEQDKRCYKFYVTIECKKRICMYVCVVYVHIHI